MFISKEPLLVIVNAYTPVCPMLQFIMDCNFEHHLCEAIFEAMQLKFIGREDLMDNPVFELCEWVEEITGLEPVHPNYSAYDWEQVSLYIRDIITRVEHIYDNPYWRTSQIDSVTHHGPLLVYIAYVKTDSIYIM